MQCFGSAEDVEQKEGPYSLLLLGAFLAAVLKADDTVFCCQWLEKKPYAAKVLGFFPSFFPLHKIGHALSYFLVSRQDTTKGKIFAFPLICE